MSTVFSKLIKRICAISLILLAGILFTGCFASEKQESELKSEGINLLQQGNYEAAIIKFDEALAIRANKKIDRARADILKYRAEAEFLAQDYRAADYTYTQLGETQDDAVQFQMMRVICLSRTGENLEEAKALYNQVENSSVEETVKLKALAELTAALSLTREGSAQALEYYRAYIEGESEPDASLCNHIGTLYIRNEEYDEAIAVYTKGLEMNPDTDIKKALLFNLAVAYEHTSSFERALEVFDEYVKEYGGEEAALHEIAFIKSRMRK